MTSQEAREQVYACERQIISSFNNLKDDARNMGAEAVQEASSSTTIKTLVPLNICLLGFILCFLSHPGWGILLIILGIIVAYNVHKSAASVQQEVENQQRNLNTVLDYYSKI